MKPNLLWIFCDQLRTQSLSCNGEPNLETTNLDRLASEGVNYATAVTPCPVCTPARAAVVTGQYAPKTEVHYLGDLLEPGTRTAAHIFRDAGYRTSYVGKWHLASTQNAVGHNAGMDFWVHPKLRGGFEDWMGFELSNNFWKTAYCTDDRMWPPKWIEGYQTDRLVDLSLDYLKGLGRNQPWFHVLSVEAPHHGADEEGRDKVQVGELTHSRHPAPGHFEAAFQSVPVELRANVPEELNAVATSQQREYLAQIASLDEQVGRVLDWLEESGQAEDTVVCFFSDHGEFGGSHGRFQKGSFLDESALVPFMIRYPGVLPTGQTVRAPVSLVDLLPTCMDLCGLPAEPHLQGYNLATTAMGQTPHPRKASLIHWFGNIRYGTSEGSDRYHAIRTEDALLACGENHWNTRLYCLPQDPYQLQNRFEDPECAGLRHDLLQLLKAEIVHSGEKVPAYVESPVTPR